MAESLLRPDSAGSMPGGTTAAENITGGATPGAGSVNGIPTSNDSASSVPGSTDPGATGQTPTGGGKAVPDNDVLQQSDSVGDSSGFGDGGTGPVDGSGSDTAPAVGESNGSQPATAGVPTDSLTPG